MYVNVTNVDSPHGPRKGGGQQGFSQIHGRTLLNLYGGAVNVFAPREKLSWYAKLLCHHARWQALNVTWRVRRHMVREDCAQQFAPNRSLLRVICSHRFRTHPPMSTCRPRRHTRPLQRCHCEAVLLAVGCS